MTVCQVPADQRADGDEGARPLVCQAACRAQGTVVIHCTIPTPDYSPLSGADEAEFRLREGVRSVVLFGRPRGTVLRAFSWEVVLYDLLELRPGFLPQW